MPDPMANMTFLLDMLNIFPLVSLSVFEKTEGKAKPSNLLYIKAKGVKGTGYEDAKGFVVCKGTEVHKGETDSFLNFQSVLRRDLQDQGVLEDAGKHFRFTQDHVFGSPSTAASVVLGRNSNGRIEWKNKQGKTLKAIQMAESEK